MTIKAMKGVRREHLASILDEMVWRSNYKNDLRRILLVLLKASE